MSVEEETSSDENINLLGTNKSCVIIENDVNSRNCDGEHNLAAISRNMIEVNNIIIVEESSDPNSTAAILNVCKKKIIKPYMRFLCLIGLRPLIGEYNNRLIVHLFNCGYTIQVVLFLILGYCLQYIACFRRDRGFGRLPSYNNNHNNNVNNILISPNEMNAIYEKTCNDSLVFTFVIPSFLHFTGYIYALIVIRASDDNQLLVLIERVFLLSSQILNVPMNQRHIVRILWFFITASFLWMLSSIIIVNYMMAEGDVDWKWLSNSSINIRTLLKILLIICIIWHDMVQASVISNYCLQAQLLRSYIYFLKEKLQQQPVRPLDWIRELEEFKKLLAYFNSDIMPPICFFTLINWSYAISGSLWLFQLDQPYNNNNKDHALFISTTVNIFNVILWWFIAIIPFIQAARLTVACETIKTMGEEIRNRMSIYQETPPVSEINSILIYANSLKLNAKLFNLPINGKYIGIVFAIVVIYILISGQNHNLHLHNRKY